MDFGLAFQFRSASAGIASNILRVETSSRSYSAISSLCISIGNLQNLLPDKNTGNSYQKAKKKRINSRWQKQRERSRALGAGAPSSLFAISDGFKPSLTGLDRFR